MNEKQRADHSDSQLKLIQAQAKQLESRNEELEIKFADITKANLELQKVERELRDQIVTSVQKTEYDSVKKKIEVYIRKSVLMGAMLNSSWAKIPLHVMG